MLVASCWLLLLVAACCWLGAPLVVAYCWLVAGLLLALRSDAVGSEIGLTFGLKAMAIMAIGGMGDMRGAVLAALLIGVIEALMFYFGWGRLGEMTVWLAMILICASLSC